MSKLSAVQVRNAKPKGRPYKLRDGQGLYFHIATSGKKTWRYRFRVAGKESTFTLGEYPQMTLEQARAAKIEAREQVKDGKNPAQERQAEKQAAMVAADAARQANKNTFEFIALEWIEQQRGRWKHDHATAVLTSLRNNVFSVLGETPVDAITPPMVLQVIRPIESRGSLGIATKVLQRMGAIFRYAVQTGKATYNPAADMRGVLKTRKVTHRAALKLKDIPKFLQKLKAGDIHNTTKLALQFAILTAARSGEVRGATWREIDLDNKLWKISGSRMKMDFIPTGAEG